MLKSIKLDVEYKEDFDGNCITERFIRIGSFSILTTFTVTKQDLLNFLSGNLIRIYLSINEHESISMKQSEFLPNKNITDDNSTEFEFAEENCVEFEFTAIMFNGNTNISRSDAYLFCQELLPHIA